MGIVDGRAEDESVRLLGTGAKLVDGIVEDAGAGFAAASARQKISLSIPCSSSAVATSASAR